MNNIINKNIPEILSPAGEMESAIAAINNGCNAIYLGGKNFSARSSAKNFSDEEISQIIDYAHLRGVKVYITVNSLYKNSELSEVFKFLNNAYEYGADAFIVQDIGTGLFIKKHFPSVSLHASTQMTVHNLEGVLYLESLGFKRVVLSRELSISEIKHITQNTKTEIEIFVHGALCVSYSGQCLISGMIGQRSGNRGKCAQSCRMKYKLCENGKALTEDYLLSPKDINALEVLPELIDANVTSLKIEGRMKNPDYVSIVTKTFREHLDKAILENYKINMDEYKKLVQIFNRGGDFSGGYFKTYSGQNMMSIKTPKSTGLLIGEVTNYNSKTKVCEFFTKEKLTPGDGIEIWTREEPHVGTNINKPYEIDSRVLVPIDGDINKGDLIYRSFDKSLKDEAKSLNNKDTRKLLINGSIKAKLNEPLEVKFYLGNISAFCKGDVVISPINKPILKDELVDRMNKLGTTSFICNFENNEIDENIFIPVGEINRVRREAISFFEKSFLKSFKRDRVSYDLKFTIKNSDTPKKITVLARSKRIFDIAITENVYCVYLDSTCLKEESLDYYVQASKEKNKLLYISLPTITRQDDVDDLNFILDDLESSDIDGYLVKNYGELYLLNNSKKEIVINYNFNIFNTLSNNFMQEHFERVCLSLELNLVEINDMASDKNEIVVYGKTPVMNLAQCPIGLYVSDKNENRFCSKRFTNEKYTLVDRKDLIFPVKPNCDLCFAEVFNCNAIFMLDKYDDIAESNAEFLRLEFLNEGSRDVRNIIFAYEYLLNNNSNHQINEIKEDVTRFGITHGHYYRGVL